MIVKTRYFGDVDLDDEKILTFERGIIGFEELRKFALIYNNENGSDTAIQWLQSVEERSVALPVIDPSSVIMDYNPSVEDSYLTPLGPLTPDDTAVFVTLTVPEKIENMSVNLKAPIVINAATKKGCQVITESDFPVKYNIYDVIKKMKEEKGE